MIRRRSLLAAILGACAAPAIVRASSLMPVRRIIVPPSAIWTPQNGDVIRFTLDTSNTKVWAALNDGEFRLLPMDEFKYAIPTGFRVI